MRTKTRATIEVSAGLAKQAHEAEAQRDRNAELVEEARRELAESVEKIGTLTNQVIARDFEVGDLRAEVERLNARIEHQRKGYLHGGLLLEAQNDRERCERLMLGIHDALGLAREEHEDTLTDERAAAVLAAISRLRGERDEAVEALRVTRNEVLAGLDAGQLRRLREANEARRTAEVSRDTALARLAEAEKERDEARASIGKCHVCDGSTCNATRERAR